MYEELKALWPEADWRDVNGTPCAFLGLWQLSLWPDFKGTGKVAAVLTLNHRYVLNERNYPTVEAAIEAVRTHIAREIAA